jgi:hypothetical protein
MFLVTIAFSESLILGASVMTRLLKPIVAIQESSGVALTIPAGATVDYETGEVVLDVADLQWNGETYFANLEDVLEASSTTYVSTCVPSAWVN